jgi:signal transduction histidine kinase
MSVIETAMREDASSSLFTAETGPVRRWMERRPVVLTSAIALFVAIFLTRELLAGNAISLLYVIPIALIALELGMLAGIVAALAACAALWMWIATSDPDLGSVGVIVRLAIFLSVGAIAGRFSDRMQANSAREESLLRSGLDLARLDEREALVPLLAEHVRRALPVSWVSIELAGELALGRGAGAEEPAGERGRRQRGDRKLGGRERRDRGGELLRVPILARDVSIGWIEVASRRGRRLSAEDRLTVESIAVQAAVASENRRVLQMEREQAALRGEVERMRGRLGDQLRNASELIERHERERRGIAKQLHDEAAQAMAAALLTVGLLERDGDGQLSRVQLEQVRREMKRCIVDLRQIASSLRPPTLDELGLAMALERFADVEAERGERSLTFALEQLPDRLPPEVETATYRVIEDLLDGLEGASSVTIAVGVGGQAVEIVLEAHALAAAKAEQEPVESVEEGATGAEAATLTEARTRRAGVCVDLAGARARVELIGGSLRLASISGGGRRVTAEIPLVAESA